MFPAVRTACAKVQRLRRDHEVFEVGAHYTEM